MKGFIFLVVNLVVSSASLITDDGSKIVEIDEDKDIPHANSGSKDDILELKDVLRSGLVNVDRRWTSPVPYSFEDGLEMNAKGVIMRAFEQFRLKSCIDFKPRDSERYYISVQKLGGCFSYVGKVLPNGQTLSIGRFCDTLAIVEHEFLHALGFFHEQSRHDRDDYVTIEFENIIEGFESNFNKISESIATTQDVPYDFWSVMHYGKNAFSNGNGSTITTKDPKFQNIIGQRKEMSSSDVLELNLLYKCNSTIAFMMSCSFSNRTMCQMDRCSQKGNGWEMVTKAPGGPSSGHTSLPSGSRNQNGNNILAKKDDYFMHASTASGQQGDSAWLQTRRMKPNRECNIQCLQFYYYHNGDESDELNIWIREFKDEKDITGTLRLTGQITGPQTSYWKLHHVSLNATKHFQVEFEVRKGAGSSSGGFSIDDINLSETECPHVTMQINDFEKLLNTSASGTVINSPRQYSRGGYAYRVGVYLVKSYFGVYVQLLSGKYDKQLEWPCVQRQVTFQILDQNPDIKLQMSKQRSITTDNSTDDEGKYNWGNPREVGTPFVDENNETIFAGPRFRRFFFGTVEEIQYRDFLKGGNAIFAFSFQDITPLVTGSTLPCPKVGPVEIKNPPKNLDLGPCSTRIGPTTRPPPKTTDDDSIFGISPALVASPVLTLLLALMLLMP